MPEIGAEALGTWSRQVRQRPRQGPICGAARSRLLASALGMVSSTPLGRTHPLAQGVIRRRYLASRSAPPTQPESLAAPGGPPQAASKVCPAVPDVIQQRFPGHPCVMPAHSASIAQEAVCRAVAVILQESTMGRAAVLLDGGFPLAFLPCIAMVQRQAMSDNAGPSFAGAYRCMLLPMEKGPALLSPRGGGVPGKQQPAQSGMQTWTATWVA